MEINNIKCPLCNSTATAPAEGQYVIQRIEDIDGKPTVNKDYGQIINVVICRQCSFMMLFHPTDQ